MRTSPICLLIAFLASGFISLNAQVNARMFQYPDVSSTHISFVYAGDIWVAPKEGGMASRLTSADGPELFPKFSPDGKTIAYTANYDGNMDVYTLPSLGGMGRRLSHHDFFDRVLDWHPDGNRILFVSSRESGKQRFSQFYLAPLQGGIVQKLPLAYGEMASFSSDGNKIAFTERSQVERTWKRYRGGMATDILLFDLNTLESELIAPDAANDEIPMWVNGKIYFLSDRGKEIRYNIWSYDPASKEIKQITHFTDFDIHYPSAGPSDIVFEAGGKLYLLNLASEQYKEIQIMVITDQMALLPKNIKVAAQLNSLCLSPDGKRVVAEARGELFSLPAEYGYVKNLSQTSGSAERYPAWSPDGKFIAYWSDKSGEYELSLLDIQTNQEKTLTSYGPGYRYNIFWSPDSKKMAFVDQSMTVWIYDMSAKKTVSAGKDLWLYQGGLHNFNASWSSDSRWLAFSLGLDNRASSLFLFDTKNNTKTQITSGFYNDDNPVFDPEGKYLYFTTNRQFTPYYSNFDNSWIYANSTRLAAIPLRTDEKSPMEPRNDEVSIKDEKEEKENKEGKEEKKEEKGKKQDKEGDKKEEVKSVEIHLEGLEYRIVLLSPDPGNYRELQAVKGKLVYQKYPNTGSAEKAIALKYFDFEKREEKTILGDADFYMISFNGEKVLARKGNNAAVVSLAPDQKMEKNLRFDEMEMKLDPKAEWKQIFMDAWRFERDFFYDKGMHGVDWNLIREKYGKLLEDASSRWDVNYILGEMIGELNASHTYRGGGDLEQSKTQNTGYLGIDWEVSNGFFRIKQIVKAAPWDVEARSPLAHPGLDVKNGEYILAVNGIAMDISKEPYAAFQGLAEKTVELTINSKPSWEGSRKVMVEALGSEARLRNLAWINNNRLRVEQATNGRVGYVYVPSTGIDGQTELLRQFMGQWQKEGLIIDERFNDGGQIPDRFIELLNRKPLAYWAVRDGKDWQWPPVAHFGQKVMLINGWSGSGGDAFPDYFRKAGLGPLIGMRTWGGLIGISGSPQLIDGGFISVPTFRMYDPDGQWFKEGYGVDPDIEVRENPSQLAKGVDTQLEKAIEVILKEINEKPYKKPEHPPYEKR